MIRRRRRGWWRGLALAALGLALLLTRCGEPADQDVGERGDGPGPGEAAVGRVLEVIDGDTIVVELAGGARENVRYIGIDTPESNPDQPLECFGPEASEANERLVGGRELTLSFGPERRDQYGRLLAFVRVGAAGSSEAAGAGGLLVNAQLVERGYARTLTIAPNDVLAPKLRRLEDAAARAGRGLWGACNAPLPRL